MKSANGQKSIPVLHHNNGLIILGYLVKRVENKQESVTR